MKTLIKALDYDGTLRNIAADYAINTLFVSLLRNKTFTFRFLSDNFENIDNEDWTTIFKSRKDNLMKQLEDKGYYQRLLDSKITINKEIIFTVDYARQELTRLYQSFVRDHKESVNEKNVGLFHSEEYAKAKFINIIEHYDPNYLNIATLAANQELNVDLEEDKKFFDKIYIACGSNRNSFIMDLSGIYSGSRSAFKDYQTIIKTNNLAHEMLHGPGSAKIDFFALLMPDVIHNLKLGTSYQRICDEYKGNPPKEHAEFSVDDNKFHMVYAFIHAFFSTQPLSDQDQVVFELLDDLEKTQIDDKGNIITHGILDNLYDIFNTYPELLPKGVVLRLTHYNGKLGKKREVVGTGEIDYNWAENVKLFISLCYKRLGYKVNDKGQAITDDGKIYYPPITTTKEDIANFILQRKLICKPVANSNPVSITPISIFNNNITGESNKMDNPIAPTPECS